MSYLGDNIDLENYKWRLIEISKVDDEVIKKLVSNLNSGLSDEFFISFESLLKIGKRAEPNIKAVLTDLEEKFAKRKEIFNLVLSCIRNKEVKNPLIHHLYHPDFEVRARAIGKIEERKDLFYIPYILPLLEDPDDSVRWALIKLLVNLKQVKNPAINEKLKQHLERESNPIIREKISMLIT